MLVGLDDDLLKRKKRRCFKLMRPFSVFWLVDYDIRTPLIPPRQGSLAERDNLSIPLVIGEFCLYGREGEPVDSHSACLSESSTDSEIPPEIRRQDVSRSLRALALLMCKHSRLGQDSRLNVLTPEIMQVIVDYCDLKDVSACDCFGRLTYHRSIVKSE